jgi:inhibitor of KinA sporulation pathway (predicted exonuclease)
MNYVVFDLEFNQAYKDNHEKNPKCPFEIIQIGAVKLDENFNTIDTFDKLIKPEVYTELSPIVKNITKISEDDLDLSNPFEDIYNEFINFVKGDGTIFCIWGLADIKEFFRNVVYHKLDTSIIPREYINLQNYASRYFNSPNGTNIGLSTTVKLLDIKMDTQFHNAYNDAYYTAEILKKLYTDKIEIKTYDPNNEKNITRVKKGKSKVDFLAMIKQIEKMFNRAMTDDEKQIIKLAYIMGKTNQFQSKPVDNVKK